MIPDHFKENISLEINPFGKPVQVNYCFYWPEKKWESPKDPLFSFMEFRSEPGPISETGYHSYFFHTQILKQGDYPSIEAFVLAVAEHLAKENGYERPVEGSQLQLF